MNRDRRAGCRSKATPKARARRSPLPAAKWPPPEPNNEVDFLRMCLGRRKTAAVLNVSIEMVRSMASGALDIPGFLVPDIERWARAMRAAEHPGAR